MINPQLFRKYPELKELFEAFRHAIQQAKRPANEIIMDDNDVMQELKISKRLLQDYKKFRKIPYQKFDRDSPRTYYFLSDILDILRSNRVESINNELKIKF